jgi:urate oxidase
VEGDNSAVVATDTMKNFILREALGYDGAALEGFLAFLGRRFLATYPVMEAVRMRGRELRFDRLGEGVVFSRSRDDHAVASLDVGPGGVSDVRGGVHDLWLLKTTGSAFTHFARDDYTTLPERGDRPLFVRLDVDWTYAGERYAEPRAIRDHLAATFDDFVSESIQHLVHEMGTRLLADHEQLASVSFTAENHTRDPVGADGDRRVFTDPFPAQGLITLTLERPC